MLGQFREIHVKFQFGGHGLDVSALNRARKLKFGMFVPLTIYLTVI